MMLDIENKRGANAPLYVETNVKVVFASISD